MKKELYKCIESFKLPYSDFVRPYKNEIVINEGEKWGLEKENPEQIIPNYYRLINENNEWIEIPEYQLNKYFKRSE